MSALSLRQLVIAAIAERLTAITVVNLFQTNAGAALYIGESPQLGPEDPSEAIAMIVEEDSLVHQAENVVSTLPIRIEALAKASLDQPWMAVEAVIADIKTAVELPDRTLGGLISRLRRAPTRPLEREPGSTSVGAAVTYLVPMVEGWGAP